MSKSSNTNPVYWEKDVLEGIVSKRNVKRVLNEMEDYLEELEDKEHTRENRINKTIFFKSTPKTFDKTYIVSLIDKGKRERSSIFNNIPNGLQKFSSYGGGKCTWVDEAVYDKNGKCIEEEKISKVKKMKSRDGIVHCNLFCRLNSLNEKTSKEIDIKGDCFCFQLYIARGKEKPKLNVSKKEKIILKHEPLSINESDVEKDAIKEKLNILRIIIDCLLAVKIDWELVFDLLSRSNVLVGEKNIYRILEERTSEIEIEQLRIEHEKQQEDVWIILGQRIENYYQLLFKRKKVDKSAFVIGEEEKNEIKLIRKIGVTAEDQRFNLIISKLNSICSTVYDEKTEVDDSDKIIKKRKVKFNTCPKCDGRTLEITSIKCQTCEKLYHFGNFKNCTQHKYTSNRKNYKCIECSKEN